MKERVAPPRSVIVLALIVMMAAAMWVTLPPVMGTAVAGEGAWERQDSGTTVNINAVSAVGTDEVWAAGNGGAILYSGSAGEQWGAQDSGMTTDLYGISMNKDTGVQGWAAGNTSWGARNMVYFDGKSWTKQDLWYNRYIRGVSSPGHDHCVVVGLEADSWRTIDGGKNWPAVSWEKHKDMYGVTSTFDNTGGKFVAWIVGENGCIAHSADLGKSKKWSTQSSPVDALILRGVSAVDPNTAWAVGDNGTILKTTDGGATQWKQQASPTGKDLHAVCAVDASTAWAVGETGTIIKTEDGTNWSTEASGTSKDLNGVSAVDSENAWAVGDTGTILHYVPQPKIMDCSPDSAHQGETLTVEITGSNTNFEQGESVVSLGTGITVDSSFVVNPTEVNAEITVADDAPTGTRDVQVTTGGETPTALSDGFTVLEKPKEPPRIDNVDPDHGTTGTRVTLSGSHFGSSRGDSWVMFNDGVTVYDYYSWADGEIVCEVPSGAQTGPVFVHTWTDSNKDHVFTIDQPHVPTITDVLPNHVKQGESNYQVNITGEYTHFGAGSTVTFSPSDGITVVSTGVSDSSHVIANINVDANAPTGNRSVTVVTGSEHPTAYPGFTVQKAQTTPPELDSLNPDWGYYGDTVTLSGRQFGTGDGSMVTFHDGKVATDYMSWADEKIEVKVPSGATTGMVTVTTSQGTSGGKLFTVSEPYIKDCDPVKVHQGNTVTLDVLGEFTHFQPGVSHIVITGGGIQIGATQVHDENHASALITVADDAAPGTRDITVVTGSETPALLKNVFTILPKYKTPPALRSLHPSAGMVGSQVVILGERLGEARGSSAVTFNGTPVTNYVSWEDHKIECTVPMGASGGLVKLNTSWGTSNGLHFDVQDFTFYFAEGTCRPGFEPYFSIQNPGGEDADVEITYMKGDGTTEVQVLMVPATTRSTVTVKQKLGEADDAAHDFSARVECTNGEEIIVERPMYFNYKGSFPGGTDVIGALATSERVYFAEGTTRPGFTPYFTIQNPGDSTIKETLSYMNGDGTTITEDVEITATTRETVNAEDKLGTGDDPSHDFSTAIQSTDSAKIVAERPQYFDYHGWCTGGTCVVGISAPTETFFLAEGTCRELFDPYITIQNPGAHQSEVVITYMRGDGETQDQALTMAPESRSTVAVKDILGSGDSDAYDFSAIVRTVDKTDIIVERPTYFNYKNMWTGGSDTVGAISDASAFYFAEGSCRPGFEPYLTIQNPNLGPADIRITYMRGDGVNDTQELTIAPHSRQTVTVTDVLGQGDSAAYDFSARVECANGRAIVAERPMYFNYNGLWPGGHDVVGFAP